MTDKTTLFDFDTWWRLFEQLKGTSWEGEDVDLLRFYKNDPAPSAPAAEALKYAYDRAREWQGPVDPEEGAAVVLNATYNFCGSNAWTPLQVMEMADHFAVFFKEMADPLQDRLDEEHGRMPLDWLTDRAREELEKQIRRPSEIWITDVPSGVWVFNKPGHTP